MTHLRNWNCLVGKIVMSRIRWAGYMIRMKDESLSKRPEETKIL